MRSGEEFFNLYNHDFIRVAAATPSVRVADPAFNAAETITLMQEAARNQSALVAFPELGISGYSCDDLFHQRALARRVPQMDWNRSSKPPGTFRFLSSWERPSRWIICSITVPWSLERPRPWA